MTARLKILESSLIKKKEKLEQMFANHFADVKSANGQPLNDKRNGAATLNRWEKQSNALRKQEKEIEKTKEAIKREKEKIDNCQDMQEKLPLCILEAVDSGILIQWRRHPRFFFVKGVERGRIGFENGKIFPRYHTEIPNQEQYSIFRDAFNGLAQHLNGLKK